MLPRVRCLPSHRESVQFAQLPAVAEPLNPVIRIDARVTEASFLLSICLRGGQRVQIMGGEGDDSATRDDENEVCKELQLLVVGAYRVHLLRSPHSRPLEPTLPRSICSDPLCAGHRTAKKRPSEEGVVAAFGDNNYGAAFLRVELPSNNPCQQHNENRELHLTAHPAGHQPCHQ